LLRGIFLFYSCSDE